MFFFFYHRNQLVKLSSLTLARVKDLKFVLICTVNKKLFLVYAGPSRKWHLEWHRKTPRIQNISPRFILPRSFFFYSGTERKKYISKKKQILNHVGIYWRESSLKREKNANENSGGAKLKIDSSRIEEWKQAQRKIVTGRGEGSGSPSGQDNEIILISVLIDWRLIDRLDW